MQPRRGTGFTNVSQMLRANQNNRLGSTVTGGIQQQTQTAQSGIQQAQQTFQQESEKNRLDSQANIQKKEEVLSKFTPQSGQQQEAQPPQMQSNIPVKTAGQQPVAPQTLTNMQGQIANNVGGRTEEQPQQQLIQPVQQSTSPTPIKSESDLISDEDIDFFGKLRAGQYEGPRGLEDFGMLANKALQAEQTGQLTRSAGGREELLRRFVGGEDYTGGQRRMDQAILSQDKNVNLGAEARQARGTLDKLGRAEQSAMSTGRDLEGRARDFAEKTMTRLGETKDPLSADLDNRIKKQQEIEAQRAQQIQQIQNRLKAPANIQQFRDDQKFVEKEAKELGQFKAYVMTKRSKISGQGMGMSVSPREFKEVPMGTPGAIMRTSADPYGAKSMKMDDFNQRQAVLNQKQNQLTQMQKANADITLSDNDRARAALNQAVELGLMSREEANEIVGQQLTKSNTIGLTTLAGDLGFDLASAVADRLNTVGAQNLSRTGLATDEDRAKLNALDRLMGKQGTDLEFTQNDPRFQTTRATADVSNLREFLTNLRNRQPGEALPSGGDGGNNNDLAKFLINPTAVFATGAASNVVNSIVRSLPKIRISDENKKESISYDPKDVEKFMGRLKASSYNYKPEVQDSPLASKNREIGVMAQDLEKSKLGKESVINTPKGKIVDYDNLGPKMLASIANLNERLKKMEKQ